MFKSYSACFLVEIEIYTTVQKSSLSFINWMFIQQGCIVSWQVSWASNQHIRMISEGSCDTEDCSNDAENSALHHRINYILKYFQIENTHLKVF